MVATSDPRPEEELPVSGKEFHELFWQTQKDTLRGFPGAQHLTMHSYPRLLFKSMKESWVRSMHQNEAF
jgi:hypothetical protein